MKINELNAVVVALTARVEALETQVIALTTAQHNAPRGRNYGPKSETPMTDLMAWRIKYGDLKGVPVKTIADENGLSRGQIYSVRGNYTFTKVRPDTFAFKEITNEDGSVTTIIE